VTRPGSGARAAFKVCRLSQLRLQAAREMACWPIGHRPERVDPKCTERVLRHLVDELKRFNVYTLLTGPSSTPAFSVINWDLCYAAYLNEQVFVFTHSPAACSTGPSGSSTATIFCRPAPTLGSQDYTRCTPWWPRLLGNGPAACSAVLALVADPGVATWCTSCGPAAALQPEGSNHHTGEQQLRGIPASRPVSPA
jgi:hypothetical protein